ncbi:MAG: DUF2829 domain-containing protein [Gammaproteobacteria bacterium]|nr:DUF2829 domain-containing protein [Gammaproteobacteria bacterium]
MSKNLYIGTKLVAAFAMSRLEYNHYRDWDLPDDEGGSDAGFLIEDINGGATNHPDHEGYISWSPTVVFEQTYQPKTNMNFGHAIEFLKRGKKLCRAGWNGKNMFIFLTEGRDVPNNKERSFALFDGDTVTVCSHIDMRTADGSFATGWLASQADMLADDWMIAD